MNDPNLTPSKMVGVIRAPLTRRPDATMPGCCGECLRPVHLDPRAVLFAELHTRDYVVVCEECFTKQDLPAGNEVFKLKDEGD